METGIRSFMKWPRLWVPYAMGWSCFIIYLIFSTTYPIQPEKSGAFLIMGFGVTRYHYSRLRYEKSFNIEAEYFIEKILLITWVFGLSVISFGHLFTGK